MDELEKLRYPIGKFSFNEKLDKSGIKKCVIEIEALPGLARNAVTGLNDTQLNTPYREDGWTVQQVIHHLADSHMNAYCRMKLALTENHPTIKPYEETLWAEFDDAKNLPAEISLKLLEALHTRWAHLLNKLSEKDFEKTVYHPESGSDMSVNYLTQLYSWHGMHHCAHITELRKRNKW